MIILNYIFVEAFVSTMTHVAPHVLVGILFFCSIIIYVDVTIIFTSTIFVSCVRLVVVITLIYCDSFVVVFVVFQATDPWGVSEL